MLSLGVIGAGRWGRRYIHTLSNTSGVRLARLASRNPESISIAPPGCVLTPDWREVAADSSLDGVIIATPPSLHAEMAEAVMLTGIPVLIEKPMTLSLMEARRLVEISEATHRFAMVGHTHLFSEAFRTLKQHARELGALREIHSSGGNWGPYRADTPVLWDWAPHDLAMCLDMLGASPSAIRARSVGMAKLPDGDGEAIEIQLDFSSGVQANIHVSNIDERKSRYFEARFEGGTLVYDDLAPEKLCLLPHSQGGARVSIPLNGLLPLNNLIAEFCSEIRAGSDKHGSLRLGLQVVEVLDQCQSILVSAQQRKAPMEG